MTGVLNLARELAKVGPVFPVGPDDNPKNWGKRPLLLAWQNHASRAVEDLKWPADATGVALLTGERAGVFVLDVDPGKGGEETLAALEAKHGELPVTRTTMTGGGGLHFAFEWPGFAVTNSAGKLGPGLDIRGNGGFVVAAGSKHSSGARYAWAPERGPEVAPAKAPEWLQEMLRPVPRVVQPARISIIGTVNPDHVYRRASAYLARIPGAISGSGGHTQTWKAALAMVRGFNRSSAMAELPEETCLALLASEYNPRCDPSWSEKEVRHKVEGAARDASVPWGFLLDAPTMNGASVNDSPPPRVPEWAPLLQFDQVDVPSFPLDALTQWLCDFVVDVAGFAQVRPDMPAMLSLASLSTACAGRFHVEVRDGYTESLNLFVAAVLDSGERKSIVYKLCTQTLRDVEAEMMLRARPEIAASEQKRKNLEARLKHLQGKIAKDDDDGTRTQIEVEAVKLARELEEFPRVLMPRLLADDVTPQALGILLQNCGEQLGVCAPEGGIFKILGGRYSEGVADLDLVLKAYSGEPVTVDRVSRNAIRLNHPLITFALTLQPKVLQDLATMPGALELGFAGRFLFSLPKSDVGERAAVAPPMRGEGAIEYDRKIRTLLNGRVPGQTTAAIRMSPEALVVRDAFHDEVEPRLKPGVGDLAVPGVKEWARKLVGTMARIAGILHCAQEPDPVKVKVSADTAQAAVLICRYLIDHARAAFLTMGSDPEIERAKTVLDWIRRRGAARFTQREVFESKRKSFDDKATLLRQTLELLTAHGYIRPVETQTTGPGRKSERYEVRPGFADCADCVPDPLPPENETEREKDQKCLS